MCSSDLGGLFIYSSFVLGGAPNGGWFGYAPNSIIDASPGMTFYSVGLLIAGIASTVSAVNLAVTVLNMRAPGMTLMKLPLFVWTWIITAFLLIASIPVLAGAVTMLLTDKFFGTSFFSAAGGGDPVMFQHIF